MPLTIFSLFGLYLPKPSITTINIPIARNAVQYNTILVIILHYNIEIYFIIM